VPWDDLEGTLNLGIGMVAAVDASVADRAGEVLAAAGIETSILGTVRPDDGTHPGADVRVVSGTKGVTAGAVHMRGSYRVA
jgi:phosphoribosylformylglycinamidine cyclo-ligase